MLKIIAKVGDPASAMVAGVFENLTEEETLVDAVFCTVGFNHLDIFGTYYILDTSNELGQSFSVKSSEEATTILQINGEGLRELHSKYLTNVSIDISEDYYKLLAFSGKYRFNFVCVCAFATRGLSPTQVQFFH